MEALNILPGYLCNLECSHCVNRSGPNRINSGLNEVELNQIISDLKNYPIKKLSFSGGEPTLYTNLVNKIIEAHPDLNSCEVSITTNGKFAVSYNSTILQLRSFRKLNKVQMSFDMFHENLSSSLRIENLKKACKELGINFILTMAISEPIEILKARKYVELLGVNVIFQKVEEVGRALDNKKGYKYLFFENEVLNKKCPNLDVIGYLPGKGYSSCCSSLIYNNNLPDTFHANLADHLSSRFREYLVNKTMGELAEIKKIDTTNLGPEFSSICKLCERIHSSK